MKAKQRGKRNKGGDNVCPINRIFSSAVVADRQHCDWCNGRCVAGWPRPARLVVSHERGRHGRQALEHRRFTGYLKNLGAPAPEIRAWIGALLELVIGLALVLGIGTRYAALLCVLFLIMATALAHRYWEYPAAQVVAQYNNFLKNLAIGGGALLLFVTGPGRFSIDWSLKKR
jgi:putative oxidoreductase